MHYSYHSFFNGLLNQLKNQKNYCVKYRLYKCDDLLSKLLKCTDMTLYIEQMNNSNYKFLISIDGENDIENNVFNNIFFA